MKMGDNIMVCCLTYIGFLQDLRCFHVTALGLSKAIVLLELVLVLRNEAVRLSTQLCSKYVKLYENG